MAYESLYQPDPLDFHPCDVPSGLKDYKLSEITDDQQIELNNFKLDRIKEDHIYLKNHPEIKFIVNNLIRAVLKKRPQFDIEAFFVDYLLNNRIYFQELIEKFKLERNTSGSFISSNSDSFDNDSSSSEYLSI
ncbi:uncharacterized protein LOC114330285 [Diabrotica virgifera virgifera]|uniref:Uncharacterized protein LOC114330285 n=1 Tax=Diabrotica virgifera virgifera TaxID=50390 RepID=A0A6P7FRB1_DIAVI|nr:uncharacterized protein LOC114330285 [Diabrotica virgifera virgifera]